MNISKYVPIASLLCIVLIVCALVAGVGEEGNAQNTPIKFLPVSGYNVDGLEWGMLFSEVQKRTGGNKNRFGNIELVGKVHGFYAEVFFGFEGDLLSDAIYIIDSRSFSFFVNIIQKEYGQNTYTNEGWVEWENPQVKVSVRSGKGIFEKDGIYVTWRSKIDLDSIRMKKN